MRTLEAVNDIGVDNPEITLEINPFKTSKGHDEPKVQPSALFFTENVGTRIGFQQEWNDVFIFHCCLRAVVLKLCTRFWIDDERTAFVFCRI
jgi:hypothetical protein